MQNIDIHSYMQQHRLSTESKAKKGGIYKGRDSSHDGPSATEELWENQTYIPLRGWGTPYSVIAHYTDKNGEKVYSNDQFPDIPIPAGWEWATQWTIDTSQSFGDTDVDGWCYDVTFERLINSIRLTTTSKEELASSLVRRRRWIRERICKSDEAKAQHQEQIDYLLSSLSKIEATMTSKKQDYDIAISYENDRASAYQKTMKMFAESIQLSLQEIKEYKLRVGQMREFLTLQAKLDEEYASRMEVLSVKFCPDTSVRNALSPLPMQQRDSHETTTALAPLSSAPLAGINQGALINSGADIFLSGICQASAATSSLWKSFSESVGSGMVQDTDEMLEMIDALVSSSNELNAHREQMKPLEQKVTDAVVSIKYAYHGAVLRSQAIINDINLRISGSRHVRSITHSLDEANLVRKGIDSNDMTVEMEDMWICNRFYRQAVVELSHYLQTYRTKCHKFTEEKNLVGQKIKVLFVATMQLYCHERSRIFMESVDYLKKVKTNMMDWNTQSDLSTMRLMSGRSPEKRAQKATFAEEDEDPDSHDTDRSYQAIDAINTTLDVLEQTSNAVDILSSLKLETPLASLPNCSEQILLQSIMQYTSLEMANKIVSYMKDDHKKGGSSRLPSLLDDPSGNGNSSKNEQQQYVPSLDDFTSVKVIVTADGILHLFPLEEKKSTRSGDFNRPFRSIKIEGCKVIQQPPTHGVLANSLEIHPPKSHTGILSSSKKVESIVLVPIDEDEANTWVDVLCDPLCGASLLMTLIPGTIQPSFGDSNSSQQVDEMFITVPPESLKPRRRKSINSSSTGTTSSSSSSSGQRRKSTRRGSSSGSIGGTKTSVLMEQSDAVMEEARAMMNLTQTTLLGGEEAIVGAGLGVEGGGGGEREISMKGEKVEELKL